MPRIIRTQAQHEAALARIDLLMEAGHGGNAKAELERLIALVEKYEEEHFPTGLPVRKPGGRD